jgi:large repetitive protein
MWALTGGAFPDGLQLAIGGEITGTTVAEGSRTFQVRVTDEDRDVGTASLTLNVAPALVISTTSLPNGTVGQPYVGSLSATGGWSPYNWVMTGFPGVTASLASGALSGTPTQSGSFIAVARVVDAQGTTASKTLALNVAPALIISTATVPNGTVGVQYTVQLSGGGGTPPYRWSVTGLPVGLTATTNGAISGSPTAVGTSNATARVTDSQGATTSKSYSITVVTPPAISTALLLNGTVGVQYMAEFSGTGGTPPYAWSITGLPAGLTATAAGAIHGIPTAAGTSSVTALLTDNQGVTTARSYSVRVLAPPAIGTASLPNGTAGVQYTAVVNATGGTPPYTWIINGLPRGVTSTAAGAISGTPTQSGTFDVTAFVTDAAGATTSRSYAITISAPALVISTATLPNGTVGTAYSAQVNATGGIPPYSWAFTGLPPGVAANAAGTITGTPAQGGSFTVSARVSDSTGTNISGSWTVRIAGAAVAVTACPAATAIAGSPYMSVSSLTGGTAPYAWAIAAGQLPPALALNAGSGTIAGTPSQQGNFNFTLRVTESGGSTGTRACAMTVAAALSAPAQTLPGGSVRVPYAQRLAALGGAPPYVWLITGGALPPGLTLEATAGTISGTPQLPGRFTFRARATDQTGSFIEVDLAINIASGLSVTVCATEVASAGRRYGSLFQASGGEGPYTWQVVSGTVPAGLVLEPGTGAISGLAQTPGTSIFTVRVTDRSATAATRECSIRVVAPLAISTTLLPAGNVGIAYSERLNASGGIAPYSWTTISGALPAGLFLNSGTGQITGAPTHGGEFRFTTRVTDAAGESRDFETMIAIVAMFRIADCPTPVAVVREQYVFALIGVGGQAPYAWDLSSGALPAGLTLNPASGVITGTPMQFETTDFTVRATDAATSITTRRCTLRIAPSLLLVSTARPLPGAVVGAAYDLTLAASGGRPPYTWSVLDGTLPAGVQLEVNGRLVGTPTAAGASIFTVQVTDEDRTLANQVLELRVTPAALSAVRITGVPEIASPAEQMFADIELGSAYPVPITGTLRMRVSPDPGLPEDPAVQFAAGGRSIPFTIAAGETRAVFSAGANGFQTGSVASAVHFNVSLTATGIDITPADGASALMRVDRFAPIISSVRVNRTAGGVEFVVTAFATTREITAANFRFTPPAGATFPQTEFTVDLREVGARWFGAPTSSEYGSQFTLVQPFRISGASVSSVAITLTNGQGTSRPVTVPIE